MQPLVSSATLTALAYAVKPSETNWPSCGSAARKPSAARRVCRRHSRRQPPSREGRQRSRAHTLRWCRYQCSQSRNLITTLPPLMQAAQSGADVATAPALTPALNSSLVLNQGGCQHSSHPVSASSPRAGGGATQTTHAPPMDAPTLAMPRQARHATPRPATDLLAPRLA